MIKRSTQTKLLHRVVEHNGVIYLAGIVADDVTATMGEQTRQILRKIDALLNGVGSSKSKLLRVQFYITDMSQRDAMNEAWTEWLAPDEFPARATVGVAQLGSPTTLIEIVATAAR